MLKTKNLRDDENDPFKCWNSLCIVCREKLSNWEIHSKTVISFYRVPFFIASLLTVV